MAKETIMFVCSAGMSTSLLVIKMQKAAEAKEIGSDIFAVSVSDVDNNLANKDVDVPSLGSQVCSTKANSEKCLEPKGIPSDVINMADYGMMNGEKVLDRVVTLIGE